MTPQRQNSGFPEQQGPTGSVATPPPTVRAMPASHPEQVFFHFDFLRSLQLHGRLAIGIFALALTLAAAYVLRMWPIYEAQSLVYIQPAPPHLMDRGATNSWSFDSNTYESYIQQQIHNITRSDVLLGALHKLPVTAWRQSAESEQAAADRLGRAIEVTRVGAGYQVSITARTSDAALAAQISNAVASSFIESATQELRSGDAQRIELLREERDRVLKELASDREEQEDLNKKLGVAPLESTISNPFDEQISQTRIELIKARTANDEAAARLTSMATGASTFSAALDAAADEIVSADAGMVSMKTSLTQRRSVLITQMASLTPNHPQYKQDAQEAAQINASLDSMTRDLRAKAGSHIQQQLKSDLERTASVESRLNAQLAQLTAAAGGARPRLQRFNELAADIQRLQSRLSAVNEQYRNLTMENNAPGAVYLSAAAVPPLHASQSGVLRNALVLVFAGLLLGIVAALTAHNLDPHIYSATDVPAPAASSAAASTAPAGAPFTTEEAPRLTPRPLRREPSHRPQDAAATAGRQSAEKAAPPRYGAPAAPGQAAVPSPPLPTATASASAYRPPEPPRVFDANAPYAPSVPPGETLDTDADDIPYSAASRLGGLRNLFTSFRLRGLDKDAEFGGAEPETASRSQRQPERPVYAEAYTAPPAGNSDPTDPSIAAVTASPEFLPPRALEVTEKEKEPLRPANPAPVQRDPEELRTLPSWRGQYRRRR